MRSRNRVIWLGWIRHLVPEVFFPAEVLPVGILYPAVHHRFIRFIEGVLQVVQPDHQPDRDAGTALLRIQGTEPFFHRRPAGSSRPAGTARGADPVSAPSASKRSVNFLVKSDETKETGTQWL